MNDEILPSRVANNSFTCDTSNKYDSFDCNKKDFASSENWKRGSPINMHYRSLLKKIEKKASKNTIFKQSQESGRYAALNMNNDRNLFWYDQSHTISDSNIPAEKAGSKHQTNIFRKQIAPTQKLPQKNRMLYMPKKNPISEQKLSTKLIPMAEAHQKKLDLINPKLEKLEKLGAINEINQRYNDFAEIDPNDSNKELSAPIVNIIHNHKVNRVTYSKGRKNQVPSNYTHINWYIKNQVTDKVIQNLNKNKKSDKNLKFYNQKQQVNQKNSENQSQGLETNQNQEVIVPNKVIQPSVNVEPLKKLDTFNYNDIEGTSEKAGDLLPTEHEVDYPEFMTVRSKTGSISTDNLQLKTQERFDNNEKLPKIGGLNSNTIFLEKSQISGQVDQESPDSAIKNYERISNLKLYEHEDRHRLNKELEDHIKAGTKNYRNPIIKNKHPAIIQYRRNNNLTVTKNNFPEDFVKFYWKYDIFAEFVDIRLKLKQIADRNTKEFSEGCKGRRQEIKFVEEVMSKHEIVYDEINRHNARIGVISEYMKSKMNSNLCQNKNLEQLETYIERNQDFHKNPTIHMKALSQEYNKEPVKENITKVKEKKAYSKKSIQKTNKRELIKQNKVDNSDNITSDISQILTKMKQSGFIEQFDKISGFVTQRLTDQDNSINIASDL